MANTTGVVYGPSGSWKAQPLDAKILTVTGWKLMSEIEVGDEVIGSNGLPSNVIGVHPQGLKEVYKVGFQDGSSTECTMDHLWGVLTAHDIHKHKRKPRVIINRKRVVHREPKIKTPRILPLFMIQQILNKQKGNKRDLYIPIVEPITFTKREHYIDPYLLGLLIGDGGFTTSTTIFSTGDVELLEATKALLPEGMDLSQRNKYDFRLTRGYRGPKGSAFKGEIVRLGLQGKRSSEKFIPTEYKIDSVDNRLALLQGLLDTDGSIQNNSVSFYSKSILLAEDVKFLVQSLGGRATIHRYKSGYTKDGTRIETGHSYAVPINLPEQFLPFRLTRKLENFHPKMKYVPRRLIASVTLVGSKVCQCISVDAPDGLYVTDDCILTHNTTQLGFLSKYIYEKTGKPLRYVSSDGGGWKPILPYIQAGLIEPLTLLSEPNPIYLMHKIVQGYWPLDIEEGVRRSEKIISPDHKEKGVGSIGGYFFEGITSLSDFYMIHIRGRKMGMNPAYSMKLSSVGEQLETTDEDKKRKVEIVKLGKELTLEGGRVGEKLGDETTGANSQDHYGFVQNEVIDNLLKSWNLPVEFVIWTGHEHQATDEMTRQVIRGPGLVGNKGTAKIGRNVGFMIHADVQVAKKVVAVDPKVVPKPGQVVPTKEVEFSDTYYYFVKHPDKHIQGLSWEAKPRIPAMMISSLLETYPEGYFKPTLEGGLDLYLRKEDELVAKGTSVVGDWKKEVDKKRLEKEKEEEKEEEKEVGSAKV